MTGEPAGPEGTAWETADRRVADFAQFARAHLRNPAERSAYLALAGTPDESWSASAIAQRSHADVHEVDVALRRFAAAGIAEATGTSSTGERLYRWHTTMVYLHAGDRADTAAVDPVCGMPVPDDSAYTETTEAQLQRFCSLRCQVAWRAASRGT